MMYICLHYRAIYFSVYAKMKRTLKSSNVVKKDSLFIPLFAGACAGMSMFYLFLFFITFLDY